VRTESIHIQNFIDGQFVEPIGGKYRDLGWRWCASPTALLSWMKVGL